MGTSGGPVKRKALLRKSLKCVNACVIGIKTKQTQVLTHHGVYTVNAFTLIVNHAAVQNLVCDVWYGWNALGLDQFSRYGHIRVVELTTHVISSLSHN